MEHIQALFFPPTIGVIPIWWRAKQALKWIFKKSINHHFSSMANIIDDVLYAIVPTYTGSLLWNPELVWPSAGMWSEAGNV